MCILGGTRLLHLQNAKARTRSLESQRLIERISRRLFDNLHHRLISTPGQSPYRFVEAFQRLVSSPDFKTPLADFVSDQTGSLLHPADILPAGQTRVDELDKSSRTIYERRLKNFKVKVKLKPLKSYGSIHQYYYLHLSLFSESSETPVELGRILNHYEQNFYGL